MATWERGLGTATDPSAADARRERRLRLDWSAILGGTALGGSGMLLLLLLGAGLGFAPLEPFTASAGAAVWTCLAALASSLVGAWTVVRLAGDRRRGESLLHGAMAWSLSMIALLAIFASGATGFGRGRTTVRERPGVVVVDSEAAATGAAVAVGASLSGLVGALFGALLGASRQSGLSLKNELRLGAPGLRRHAHEGGPHAARLHAPSGPPRDETTILPPTH